MKRGIIFWIPIILGLTGCTTHYYKVQADKITIYLKAPSAEKVDFVSSLDGYKIHAAEKINSYTWAVTISASSEFKYFYIVDGVLYLPACRFKEKDDFSSANCIYVPEM
ncbi:MAG: hypothetical protein JW786_12960 [Desulfobacterales bacterium]|nr:hypothetical protein [Desulfobacterales bacterium]